MLLLAALNPRPSLSLRLLTFRSPALPLGVWLAAAGLGGAGVSALATGLALRRGERARWRSGSVAPGSPRWTGPDPGGDAGSWPDDAWSERGDGGDRQTAGFHGSVPQASVPTAGPTRAPGEPAPTVAVPYRVIRRPAAADNRGRPAQEQEQKVAGTSDDWQQQSSEDW